ncbi:enhanced serine sensitivity protein SseB [Streptomyces sp. GC420]|uniref:enhanced serine sensitivity protein SseB n=1 Tax=Streptomyces sp. GC420 TaxID=2697568 RepID=UPI001414FCDB|nr:enhanced serine sensitivity protein SseB [Streptomyces sp. GC420]NBM17150.1 enhanced serine sensitivity protein SseB [Streptomyces sp. GC420]
MEIPAQAHRYGGGWPGNELEEVLAASLGNPNAGARIIEVLQRSFVWVPLPNGGGPDSRDLDLPTMDVGGAAHVPVFSSEQQFLQCVGPHMSYTIAPAVEFARGLPPQLGVAVNPGGTVGVPLPPPAVAELCRAGRSPLDGPASGGRVRLFEPDWQEEPVDFLAAAAGEFQESGVVLSARRCLASIEAGAPVMFVGVELGGWEPEHRTAPMDALGRALGRVQVPWPVNLVLLDIAQDPVGEWMLEKIRPFYTRHGQAVP